MSPRETLLQLVVWLIQAGYAQDSKEVELIQKTLKETAADE